MIRLRSIALALAPAIGIVVFLVVWQLAVDLLDIRPFILRSPVDIVAYLGKAPGDFASASLTTALHAATGFLVAFVVAVALGALLASSPFLERATQPVLTIIQVTPFAAYIGAVVVWLDGGDPPVRFITTLVCIPAFVFAAVAGLRSADLASRELFASVDAGRWQVLWRLRLPSSLPALFIAARYNVGLALIAAYLVEGSNFADEGLGAIGRRAAANNLGDPLWATIFCMALLGSAALLLIGALERSLMHWHASQRQMGGGRQGGFFRL
jgi:NitT/TauT family transport system permease protein